VDNVGGDYLRAAVAHARPGARIVLVGTLAAHLAPHLSGAVAPVELDAFQLVLKGITLRGFSDPGDPKAKAEWTERFGTWLRDGVITFPHVRVPGIDHAAEALHDVIGGKHVGTLVERRIAALDAEIGRLTALRDRLDAVRGSRARAAEPL